MDISQTTGLTYPKCSGFIPLTLEKLLKDHEFICPHCGLRLTIDGKQSGQAKDSTNKKICGKTS